MIADTLRDRIRTGGPISIAAFMTEALFDPRHGFYATKDPIGAIPRRSAGVMAKVGAAAGNPMVAVGAVSLGIAVAGMVRRKVGVLIMGSGNCLFK